MLCLGQSLKMLDSEESTDNELRAKFSQRWNRTPSGDLYKPLRAGALKKKTSLRQVTANNRSYLFLLQSNGKKSFFGPNWASTTVL